jgi:predicted metal-binding protein
MILKDLERLSEEAVKLGATEAKPIRTGSVVTAEWVRLKCQFGCGGYNQHLTCPPFSPTPTTTRKILGEFKWAILLKFKPPWPGEIRNVIKEIERKFFLLGYYKAFGLASGPCEFCEKCNVKEGICKNPDKARPSMEACGIDVYATVRGADYSIEVMKTHNDTPTYYGLVLVE